MSNIKKYIEMAYRGGESYSGRDLLSRSAVGQWIYRSGIHSRDKFSFNHQTTHFHKKFPGYELTLVANISKSDPTLKTRLLKLVKEKAPEVLKDNGGNFYFMYGWFRSDMWHWEEGAKKKKLEKQAAKLNEVFKEAGMNFNFDPEYGSFTFPSETTWNKIHWYIIPDDINGVRQPATVLKPLRKVYRDKEYAQLLKEVEASESIGKLPDEVRRAITNSNIKVIK